MDAAELRARLRNPDPEERSLAIQEIALAGRFDRSLIHTLIEGLEDDDPVTKEWSTVALRRFRGNPEAIQALWETYEHDNRENVRCCALVGLGQLGVHLSSQQLHDLYRARRSRDDDLLLGFAVRWAGLTASEPDVFQALIDIEHQEEEAGEKTARPKFRAALGAAVYRCARRCLAEGTIGLGWLKEHGRGDLAERLGEARVKRRMEAERARRAQPALLPELEGAGSETSLLPGRALADVQEEQYIQDLAEWRNVRLVESRSYVRDQTLAREAKKAAAYRCQVCGDSLPGPGARRFVQAHHVEPLSEGGDDVRKNLAVLCPNCHAKLHAGAVKIEQKQDRLYVSTSAKAEAQPLLRGDDPSAARERREHMVVSQIVRLIDELDPETLRKVVGILSDRLSSHPDRCATREGLTYVLPDTQGPYPTADTAP